MKQSKNTAVQEAVVCKFSGKKYLGKCMAVLAVLLTIALAVVCLVAPDMIPAEVANIVPGLPLVVVGAVAGLVAGLVLGLVWGLLANMFAVPAARKKEQKSYLDMSALRVQLNHQRTVLAEGNAKVGKLSGRLYVTAGAVEFYAGSENNFTNYFLIPLYEIQKVKGSGSKLVIVTKMKKFVLKVAKTSGKTWKKAIKDAIKLASTLATKGLTKKEVKKAKKQAKADAKKAKKAAKKDAKKAKKQAKKDAKAAKKQAKKDAKKAKKQAKKNAKKAKKAAKKAAKKGGKAVAKTTVKVVK